MQIQYTKVFKAQYKKLPVKVQDQFEVRLALFIKNPLAPALRIHPLKGKYAGYWSMNVNGDIRVLYKMFDGELFLFALIGSHSQLY